MIDQDLINKVGVYIANEEPLKRELAIELLASYESLVKQNAAVHMELAKLKRDKVFVCNA